MTATAITMVCLGLLIIVGRGPLIFAPDKTRDTYLRWLASDTIPTISRDSSTFCKRNMTGPSPALRRRSVCRIPFHFLIWAKGFPSC